MARRDRVGADELQQEFDNLGLGLGGDGFGVEVQARGGTLVVWVWWPDGLASRRKLKGPTWGRVNRLIESVASEWVGRERNGDGKNGGAK